MRAVKQRIDAAFLKLAFQGHRERLLGAVEKRHYLRHAYLELEVMGLPGVRRAAVFCWPEPLGKPRRLTVDVVGFDGGVLDRPISFTYELDPVEVRVEELSPPASGGARRTRGGIVWTEVPPDEVGKEVLRLEKNGAPVFHTVNTRLYRFKMTCRCGRVRYARANSLYQVRQCQVCTRADRLRKRALDQYQKRHGRSGA